MTFSMSANHWVVLLKGIKTPFLSFFIFFVFLNSILHGVKSNSHTKEKIIVIEMGLCMMISVLSLQSHNEKEWTFSPRKCRIAYRSLPFGRWEEFCL